MHTCIYLCLSLWLCGCVWCVYLWVSIDSCNTHSNQCFVTLTLTLIWDSIVLYMGSYQPRLAVRTRTMHWLVAVCHSVICDCIIFINIFMFLICMSVSCPSLPPSPSPPVLLLVVYWCKMYTLFLVWPLLSAWFIPFEYPHVWHNECFL